MDPNTLHQERDMRQMRTDHEAEIMRLIFEAADAGPGQLAGVIGRVRASVIPLLDAAYGPVRAPYGKQPSPVTYLECRRPECVICGARVTDIGPFCTDCMEETPEAKTDPARRWRTCPDGIQRWLTASEWKAVGK